ncbi:MAG: AbrB/MazE/SpoVT family DNA-binding domain-containing protein [Acidobacteria bacterium]|nr:AbrB/MazE/SpoVT family DNA-binding domain-containing protein [Acidobacteriota bacterium]MBI1984120.1 AbrB/MazE/SpoVT family DNA-binding domain-containing protein [Acidobacteriota bacterium]
MAFVKVKSKFQVTLPKPVRKKARLKVGDYLEAKVEGKKITLTPQGIIERHLAEALEDIREGRVYGPFDSVEDMLQSLRKHTRRLRKKM